MRTLLTFVLSAALSAPAFASVRLVNATGQDLTVDVLHKLGQERNVKLKADRTVLSKVLGTTLEPNKEEILVVRDKEGKEIYRDSIQTNGIFVLTNSSDGLAKEFAGRFQGDSTNKKSILVINSTGYQVDYKWEKPDFSTESQKGTDVRDVHGAVVDHIAPNSPKGAKMPFVLESTGADTTKVSLDVGSFYVVKRNGAKLTVVPAF